MRNMSVIVEIPNDSRILDSHVDSLVKTLRQVNGNPNPIKSRTIRTPDLSHRPYHLTISVSYTDPQQAHFAEMDGIELKLQMFQALVPCFKQVCMTPAHVHGNTVSFVFIGVLNGELPV